MSILIKQIVIEKNYFDKENVWNQENIRKTFYLMKTTLSSYVSFKIFPWWVTTSIHVNLNKANRHWEKLFRQRKCLESGEYPKNILFNENNAIELCVIQDISVVGNDGNTRQSPINTVIIYFIFYFKLISKCEIFFFNVPCNEPKWNCTFKYTDKYTCWRQRQTIITLWYSHHEPETIHIRYSSINIFTI